jgi:hypothetical protein
MSNNYKHQARRKRRASLGKALNEIFKLPQQKYRQGVNPNNGNRSSK